MIQGSGEMMNILLRLLQDMKRKAKSAASADARKRTYGFNGLSKELRGVIFFIQHPVSVIRAAKLRKRLYLCMLLTKTDLIMKKIIFMLAASLLLISTSAMAQEQKDWANFRRYKQANSEVTAKPKAVLMGDSITDGWPRANESFFTENNFIGRGISGQTTSQMLVRFRKDVIDHHPKYVAILAGTNDIALNNGFIELENILGNIISMCEIAKANKIKPVICSVIPAKRYGWRPEIKDSAEQIKKLNEMLKKYAKENKITYVDYHSAMTDAEGGLPVELAKDGVHPTPEGYKIMEDILVKYLK